MYAVIRDGSRQHIVEPGDIVNLDLRDVEAGETVDLDDVLLVAENDDVKIGTPRVERAVVKAVVVGEVKGDKLVVFKYKRRKDSRQKTGHRQRYTQVRIDEVICS